jgi:hypothetical protein
MREFFLDFIQINLERPDFLVSLAVLDGSLNPISKWNSILRGFENILSLERIGVFHYNLFDLLSCLFTDGFDVKHQNLVFTNF